MKTCYIIGAAPITELRIKKGSDDLIIAADGGYLSADYFGITPDLIIGDFDSSETPDKSNIIKLNPIKDETDTLAAVEHAIEKGYKSFVLYGCLGGRISHTLANIALIANLAQRGIQAVIEDGNTSISAVCRDKYTFTEKDRGFISVFSHTDKSILSEVGLKYEINNFKLTNSMSIGVSNEFIGKSGYIDVTDGTVIIVKEK